MTISHGLISGKKMVGGGWRSVHTQNEMTLNPIMKFTGKWWRSKTIQWHSYCTAKVGSIDTTEGDFSLTDTHGRRTVSEG